MKSIRNIDSDLLAAKSPHFIAKKCRGWHLMHLRKGLNSDHKDNDQHSREIERKISLLVMPIQSKLLLLFH